MYLDHGFWLVCLHQKTCQFMCLGLYLYCSRKSFHMETASIWKPTHGIGLHMEIASICKQLAIKLTVITEWAQSVSLYFPNLAVLLWTHGNILLSTSCLENTLSNIYRMSLCDREEMVRKTEVTWSSMNNRFPLDMKSLWSERQK